MLDSDASRAVCGDVGRGKVFLDSNAKCFLGERYGTGDKSGNETVEI